MSCPCRTESISELSAPGTKPRPGRPRQQARRFRPPPQPQLTSGSAEGSCEPGRACSPHFSHQTVCEADKMAIGSQRRKSRCAAQDVDLQSWLLTRRPCPWGTRGIRRHFWLSHCTVGYHWHLVGGGQGCCVPSCPAQNNPLLPQ